tara:strand:- start:914 stop:3325 length:2412 start_codon:yes stop_codon:yes gene_type:complete
MQELILYIKPQQRDKTAQNYVKVDLFTDENVSLTQVIQDVRDIDKVFTDYSRTFNLPASEKNNKLFKHWYNPDVKGFDANIQSDAKIELNYQPFREGKIKLNEVSLKDNRPHTYKITFFGKTVSLNNLFGEDKLNNLEWLNNFSYENNAANVLAGLSTGKDFTVDSVTYTDAIIYPLITHSQRYTYSTNGLETEIASGTATSTLPGVLRDTNNNFTNVVIVNDIVHNITTNSYTLVEAIMDNNNLDVTGVANINSGDTYKIYRTASGNISYNTSSPDLNYNRHGIYPEDLKPAIKASLIVKAIEEQYGITFKTGEFFDSTEFSNLYLWLQRTTGKLAVAGSVSLNSSFPFTCNPSSANCSYFLNTGNLVDFTEASGITNILRSSQDKQEVTYIATITPDSSYTSVVYKIEIVNTINNNVEAALDYAVGTQSLQIKYGEFNNTLSTGQSKNLYVRVISESAFLFGCNISLNYDSTDDGLKTANFNSNSSVIGLVGDILPALEAPNIKVLDFIKGIFKMFNLTAFLNSADNIVVKTLNDFYSDSTTTHDISKFIEKNEHTVSEALPFTTIDLSFPEPETKLAKAYSEINNFEYGKAQFTADASTGINYNIEVPFEHLLYERLNKPDGTQTQVQYGYFVNENDESIIGKPLLFYAIEQSSGATGFSNDLSFVDSIRPTDGTLPTNPVTNVSVNAYWMPHNANELGSTSTAPAFNLNFGSEINSYTLTDYGGGNNSLFQKFYQTYIQRVFNTKTRIFKYKAVLPLKFLLTYSLADKVFISGRAFTINKITTDLQTGKSTLELLNEPS